MLSNLLYKRNMNNSSNTNSPTLVNIKPCLVHDCKMTKSIQRNGRKGYLELCRIFLISMNLKMSLYNALLNILKMKQDICPVNAHTKIL